MAMGSSQLTPACLTRAECAQVIDTAATSVAKSIQTSKAQLADTPGFATGMAAVVRAAGEALLSSRPASVWKKMESYMARADTADKAQQLRTEAFKSTDSQWCPNKSYFELLPVSVANVTTAAPSATWQGDGCFTSMTATLQMNSTGGQVTLSGSGATGLFCSDTYVISTAYHVAIVDVSALSPTASGGFSAWAPNTQEAQDAQLNGLRVHLLPCGLLGSVTSLLKTIQLYQDGDNTTALFDNNYAFLTERNVWPASAAVFNRTVPAAAIKASVRSGDYLAVTRFDGLDPMIMFGTGGRTGHSAVAVWDGPELYVMESTDANPFGKVFWPPPYGIIKHEFSVWISLAQQANYHMALLPLAKQYADAFNEKAFWTWFYGVQGMPYGYHSMLFSFLDTFNPTQNLPLPLDSNFFSAALNTAEMFLKNTTAGVSIFSMFTWGLNKRLGASCNTLSCIIDMTVQNQAAKQPVASLMEAIAIVDQDKWIFGTNYSMVCSEFAAHAWKAGLQTSFPVWQSIQANEQTPRDNYQMGMFDPVGRFDSTSCPGGLTQGDQNGVGTYCQMMGEWQLLLNAYNSFPLYAGQNSQCACQWPQYVRGPAGC
jgi:hypothetical protein